MNISNINHFFANRFDESISTRLNTSSLNTRLTLLFVAFLSSLSILYFLFSLKGRVSKKEDLTLEDKRTRELADKHLEFIKDDPDTIQAIRTQINEEKIPSLEILNKKLEADIQVWDKLDALFNAPTKVFEGLYLGNQRNVGVIPPIDGTREKARAEAQQYLKDCEITTIITCCQPIEEKDRFDSCSYELFEIGDSLDNREFLVKLPFVLQKIHEIRSRNENVFIHCNGGISRSPSFVIAYLMLLGLSFEEAYRYLKSKRSLVNVSNFESQLKELDIEQMKQAIFSK